MICKNCGAQLNEDSKFCTTCGSPVESQNVTNGFTSVPNQSAYQQPNYGNGGFGQSGMRQSPDAYPMKWFKFVIYFQLFVSAISCVVNAVTYFTGAHYGDSDEAEFVYDFYGSALKTCDMIFGVVYLILAVYIIYTRFQLAKFKKHAPMYYLISCGVSIAASILYLIMASSATKIEISTLLSGSAGANYITSLITSIVLIVANKIYFDKRAALFVN